MSCKQGGGQQNPCCVTGLQLSWLTRQLKQLFSREQLPQLVVVTVLTAFAWLQGNLFEQALQPRLLG